MPDHLGIDSTDSRVAIITGNPERVPVIARHFDSRRELTAARGYVCHEARLGETPVLVVAAGIGAPSTAIAVEELIDLGVSAVFRIGTCGALQTDIRVCDLVIPTACVREEGTTAQYVALSFPAVPDRLALNELVAAAAEQQTRCHVGITHCKDAYYSERPDKQLSPEGGRLRWATWRRAGVLATEMETSTLFVLGSLRGIRTGAVFVNVGKTTDPALFDLSLASAVRITQSAIKALAGKDLLTERTPRTEAATSYLSKSFKLED